MRSFRLTESPSMRPSVLEYYKVSGSEAKLQGIKPELDIVEWSRWVVELFGYVTFRILVLAGGGVVWDSWRWSSRSRLARRPTLMIKASVKGV